MDTSLADTGVAGGTTPSDAVSALNQSQPHLAYFSEDMPTSIHPRLRFVTEEGLLKADLEQAVLLRRLSQSQKVSPDTVEDPRFAQIRASNASIYATYHHQVDGGQTLLLPSFRSVPQEGDDGIGTLVGPPLGLDRISTVDGDTLQVTDEHEGRSGFKDAVLDDFVPAWGTDLFEHYRKRLDANDDFLRKARSNYKAIHGVAEANVRSQYSRMPLSADGLPSGSMMESLKQGTPSRAFCVNRERMMDDSAMFHRHFVRRLLEGASGLITSLKRYEEDLAAREDEDQTLIPEKILMTRALSAAASDASLHLLRAEITGSNKIQALKLEYLKMEDHESKFPYDPQSMIIGHPQSIDRSLVLRGLTFAKEARELKQELTARLGGRSDGLTSEGLFDQVMSDVRARKQAANSAQARSSCTETYQRLSVNPDGTYNILDYYDKPLDRCQSMPPFVMVEPEDGNVKIVSLLDHGLPGTDWSKDCLKQYNQDFLDRYDGEKLAKGTYKKVSESELSISSRSRMPLTMGEAFYQVAGNLFEATTQCSKETKTCDTARQLLKAKLPAALSGKETRESKKAKLEADKALSKSEQEYTKQLDRLKSLRLSAKALSAASDRLIAELRAGRNVAIGTARAAAEEALVWLQPEESAWLDAATRRHIAWTQTEIAGLKAAKILAGSDPHDATRTLAESNQRDVTRARNSAQAVYDKEIGKAQRFEANAEAICSQMESDDTRSNSIEASEAAEAKLDTTTFPGWLESRKAVPRKAQSAKPEATVSSTSKSAKARARQRRNKAKAKASDLLAESDSDDDLRRVIKGEPPLNSYKEDWADAEDGWSLAIPWWAWESERGKGKSEAGSLPQDDSSLPAHDLEHRTKVIGRNWREGQAKLDAQGNKRQVRGERF